MDIYEIIGQVVADIRPSGTISGLPAPGTSSNTIIIPVDNLKSGACGAYSLQIGDAIRIDSTYNYAGTYTVIAVDVDNKTITVKFTGAIVDSGAPYGSYTSLSPFYKVASWQEQRQYIQDRKNEPQLAKSLMPMFHLLLNVTKKTGTSQSYQTFDNLVLYLYTASDLGLSSEVRAEKIYRPTAYPILRAFKNSLINNENVRSLPGFTETDLFFNQTKTASEAATQNKLNAFLEAIKIDINNLTIHTQGGIGNTQCCPVRRTLIH